MEDLLAEMAKCTTFAKLDLSHAYQQIEFEETSQEYLTLNGLCRATPLAFGVKSATRILVTAALSKYIVDQSSTCIVNEQEMKKIKATIKHEREDRYKNLSDENQLNMSEKLKRLNDISKEKGVSNWLTAYPILEHGFDLNKQQFWDCLHIHIVWT